MNRVYLLWTCFHDVSRFSLRFRVVQKAISATCLVDVRIVGWFWYWPCQFGTGAGNMAETVLRRRFVHWSAVLKAGRLSYRPRHTTT